MSQLAYNLKPAVAMAGLLADIQNNEVISRTNNIAGDIPFGKAVARDGSDSLCKLPTLTGDMILGVAIHSHAVEVDALAGQDGYPADSSVNIMRQGVCWVISEDACTEGGAVYVRHGGVGDLGAFRATDDGANASLLANAKFVSSAGAGELAMIELRGSVGSMS